MWIIPSSFKTIFHSAICLHTMDQSAKFHHCNYYILTAIQFANNCNTISYPTKCDGFQTYVIKGMQLYTRLNTTFS